MPVPAPSGRSPSDDSSSAEVSMSTTEPAAMVVVVPPRWETCDGDPLAPVPPP
jgi:hypothetical protein